MFASALDKPLDGAPPSQLIKAVAILAGSVFLHWLVLDGLGSFSASGTSALSAEALRQTAPNVLTMRLLASEQPIGKCDRSNPCTRLDARRLPASPANTATSPVMARAVPEKIAASAAPIEQVSYFLAEELTVRPVALTYPRIVLPADSDERIVGSATLVVLVSSTGQVDDIVVDAASLPEDMVQAIANGYRDMHYQPGEIEGKTVNAQIRVQIDLAPNADGVANSRRAG